jgi:Rieske Fe-S protein
VDTASVDSRAPVLGCAVRQFDDVGGALMPEEPQPLPEDGCTRRRFLNGVLGTGAAATGCMVVYPIAKFLAPPPDSAESSAASVVAGAVSEFPLGSGKIFKMGSKPGLLVRLETGEFRAFSAVCTHLACTVQYRPDVKQVWCACHNGSYDLTGKNVAGPPPRPLEAYVARVLDDKVVVSRAGA